MTIARKVARNTLTQLIGRFLTVILGLILLKVITKNLGVEDSGKYLLSLTYAQFFSTVTDLGLNAYLTRDIAKSGQVEANDMFRKVLSLRLITGTFFLGLALILIFFLPYTPVLRGIIALALISGYIMLLNSMLVSIFQGFLKMETPVIADVISKILTVAGVLWVILTIKSLPMIMTVIIITAVINLLINLIMLMRIFKFQPTFKREQWSATLKSTLPIWVTSVLVLIYFKVDSLLLSVLPLPGNKNNLVEVGYYGTAYKYIEIFITFPVIFLGTMLPVMSASAHSDTKRFNSYLQISLDFLSVVALPILVGTFVLARPLITFVSSPDFLPAVPALKILIFAFLFSALGGIFSYAILSLDQQKRLIFPYAFATVFNIVINYFAIQRFSYIGAAVTTVATEIIVASCAYLIVKKQTVFKPNFSVFAKAVLSAVIMGLLLSLLPGINVFGGFVVGVVSYLIVLYLLKGIEPRILEVIKLKKAPADY